MLKFQFSKAITHLFDIKPAPAKRRRGHRRQLSVEPLEQRTLLSAVTFSPAIDYSSASAGTNVRSVAVADLNGDGHADIVTSNWNISGNTQIAGKVSVRLGDGTGSFGPAANFGVGRAPYSVAIADVNGDGRPDLAVANRGSNSISVLLGTGTGSFGAATNFAAGNAPNSVATADVNGDGKPDIVAANVYGGNVSVMLNTTATNSTTPTFGAPGYFTTGSGPFSVAIADLNGDLKPDVVTANLFSSNVSILLGTGTGSFGAPNNLTAGSVPDWVAIADIDGDGKPDLAVANGGSPNVNILLGTGTGAFGTATNFGTGSTPGSVSVADLDGDGKLDVVTANQSIGNNSLGLSVLLGDGAGSFGGTANLTAGTRPMGVAIADLNGDGKPDLVVANLINSVSVLLNTTTSPTTTTVTAANATYDGLQHGATVVVDPGSAAGTTTFLYTGTGATVYSSNVAPSDAGTYHVVATFTPANLLAYDPSTGSADYTIGKAAIGYTIDDAGHVYGSTVDLATVLGTTFLTGVSGENLGIAYSSDGNTSTANAGNYGITGLVSDGSGLASNYTVTLTSGTLTVSRAILTGNATTQDALNMAKQGKLTISVSNVSGLLNGDTLTTFLSTAEFYITVGENKYVFVPSTVTTSESSITVSYSLKNPALATSLAAELDDSTSATTAVSAGFYMESLNYTFFEDNLTRLFSTAK